MTERRIIRKVPLKGLEIVPSGAVLVDGYLDYITTDPAPPRALYVAEMEGQQVTVVRDATSGLGIQGHTFAGWPNPKAADEWVPPAPSKEDLPL